MALIDSRSHTISKHKTSLDTKRLPSLSKKGSLFVSKLYLSLFDYIFCYIGYERSKVIAFADA